METDGWAHHLKFHAPQWAEQSPYESRPLYYNMEDVEMESVSPEASHPHTHNDNTFADDEDVDMMDLEAADQSAVDDVAALVNQRRDQDLDYDHVKNIFSSLIGLSLHPILHLSLTQTGASLISRFRQDVRVSEGNRSAAGNRSPTAANGLRDSRHSRNVDVRLLAQKANIWLYDKIARCTPGLWGQKIEETFTTNIENMPGCKADNQIFDCARYYLEVRKMFTVLLTNDKNLCCKAIPHHIKTISYTSIPQTGKSILMDICGFDLAQSGVDLNHIQKVEGPLATKPSNGNSIYSAPERQGNLSSKRSRKRSRDKNQKPRKDSVGLDASIYAKSRPSSSTNRRPSQSSMSRKVLDENKPQLVNLLREVEQHLLDKLPDVLFSCAVAQLYSEEYVKYLKADPRKEIRDLFDLESYIARFWFSIFSEYLPRYYEHRIRTHRLSNQSRSWQRSSNELNYTDIKDWIDGWWDVWLNLATENQRPEKELYENWNRAVDSLIP